jgi:hypothetical protein
VKEIRSERQRRSGKGLRDEGVKVALLRSVSVNLAELRRVFKVKNLWFMGEIVTDGVGHLRTYGEKTNLLTQRPRRMGRGEIRD